MRRLLLIGILSVISGACSSATQPSNPVKPTPTTSPTPDAEREEYENKVRSEQQKAIEDFVARSHTGWKVYGVEAGFDGCNVSMPCNIQLEKSGQIKVVSIVIKQFERPDGSKYWLAFEARPIDLSEAKKQEIEEAERERIMGDLSLDDCQSVIDSNLDEILSSRHDPLDEPGPSVHDPRY